MDNSASCLLCSGITNERTVSIIVPVVERLQVSIEKCLGSVHLEPEWRPAQLKSS